MSRPPFTLADSAEQLAGLKEQRDGDNPLIVGMLQLFASWVHDDETAWCGAFAGFVCHLHGYPTPGPERWRALQARRWLTVGRRESIDNANGNCAVVLMRGGGNQPGPEVLEAYGHVGFYGGHSETHVTLIGGNQSNGVNAKKFPLSRILEVRRMLRSA